MASRPALASLLALAWAASAGCAHSGKAAPPSDMEGGDLHWLIGCWRTDDGTREVWSAAPGGYYFGFSTTTKNAAVVFFEQMRIEKSVDGYVFSAYPKGVGQTRFIEQARSRISISFHNDDHDYPNMISYYYDDGADVLHAVIVSKDDARRAVWTFSPCED